MTRGDLEAIRPLLNAGAEVQDVRPSGDAMLIDVMPGRSINQDAQLLPGLRLLIERGVDLNTVSDDGGSALRLGSLVGRFDAVGLLLEAGANPAPLGWTARHRAVALGTRNDVGRQRLDAVDDGAARDFAECIPLLLSLHVGDIAKAELLLAAGGSLADRERCGRTPLG